MCDDSWCNFTHPELYRTKTRITEEVCGWDSTVQVCLLVDAQEIIFRTPYTPDDTGDPTVHHSEGMLPVCIYPELSCVVCPVA